MTWDCHSCLWSCGLSYGCIPVWKRDAVVGAYWVDNVHLVTDVPETVCLADGQFDLVVGCIDSRVAHAQANRVQDVLLVAFDRGYSSLPVGTLAVARQPQPVFRPVSAWSASVVSAGVEGISSVGTPDMILLCVGK